MANIAPYWLATGTAPLLTNGTRNRMAAPVTQTPSTAVPLGASLCLAYLIKIISHSYQSIIKLTI